MWSVRASLCVVLAFVSLQQDGVAAVDISKLPTESLLSFYINNMWSEVTRLGMQLFHEYSDLPQAEKINVYNFADKHGDKVLRYTQIALDMASLFTTDGDEVDTTLSNIKESVGSLAKRWNSRPKGSAEEFVTAYTKEYLKELLVSPIDSLWEFLGKPKDDELSGYFDRSRKLVSTSVNILINNMYKVYWTIPKYEGPGKYFKAIHDSGLKIQKEFFKIMEHPSESQSVYAHHHRILYDQLIKEGAGLGKQFATLFTYSYWSVIGLLKVHRQIEFECRNENKLTYKIVHGELSAEESNVKTIIDLANSGRSEACDLYRRRMGVLDGVKLRHYNVDQFLSLVNTLNLNNTAPVSSDVLMADAIAQLMLGDDVEPACMLGFLCHAGLYRAKYEREGTLNPGVDLLLGMLVSGRHDFAGELNMDHVAKIGTPKMAEVILKGFHGQCDSYPMEGCFSRKKFMEPFEWEVDQSSE